MRQLERRLARLEPKSSARMFWIEAPSEAEADRVLAENDALAGDLAFWIRSPECPTRLQSITDMESKVPGGGIGKVALEPVDANL
jgi:hypothetical protein